MEPALPALEPWERGVEAQLPPPWVEGVVSPRVGRGVLRGRSLRRTDLSRGCACCRVAWVCRSAAAV